MILWLKWSNVNYGTHMRILIISQYYYPEPFRVHEIAEGLVAKGHDVTVFTTFPNYPEGRTYDNYENRGVKVVMQNGVKIIRVASRPRGGSVISLAISYLSFCWNTLLRSNLISKNDFDIVYSYQLSPIFQVVPAIRIAKRERIPLYLYCLDLWPESICEFVPRSKSLIFKIVKRISSAIYKRADFVGVTSPSFISYLSTVCGVDKRKIEFLPQHSDDVCLGESDMCTIDNGCVDIFFMGNVGISQNILKVIDAVRKIEDKSLLKLHIVGSGSMLKEAILYVHKLGLEDTIIFHGRRPYREMSKFYRMADVCLLTLRGNTILGCTIPGKLQNYMSAGKAILAFSNGDASTVIAEADCGICVEADNVDKLSQAIQTLLDSKDKIGQWGINAREYYKSHYTLDIHLSKLEKRLMALIKDESTRSKWL